MNDDLPSPLMDRSPRFAARVLGVVLALTGLGCIALVFTADYGGSRAAEALAFELGLAFAPALSAIGLCLVLIGGAVFWRARRR